jgi:hypothetical protein
MPISFDCPWCESKLKPLSGRLASRRPKVKPKWYGITRSVLTCPHCKKPVRLSTRGQAWALLTAPAFVLLPASTLVPNLIPKGGPALWAVSGLALLGIGLARALARLERANDI